MNALFFVKYILVTFWIVVYGGRYTNALTGLINKPSATYAFDLETSIAAAVGKIVCDHFAERTSIIHITYSIAIARNFITDIFSRMDCAFTFTLYRSDMIGSSEAYARYYNLLLAENYLDYR